MKRLTAVAGGAVFLIALTAALGGSAWGAGGPLSEMARGANPDAVADCGCTTTTPTSTTTSTSTSSTTTTSTTLLPPDAPTNSTPSVPAPNTGVPAQVQAASTTPAVSGSAALPFTAAATSQPSQLPFTGPDLRPFLLLGLLLVGLGVFLLFGGASGAHSPRRYRHQVRESAGGS